MSLEVQRQRIATHRRGIRNPSDRFIGRFVACAYYTSKLRAKVYRWEQFCSSHDVAAERTADTVIPALPSLTKMTAFLLVSELALLNGPDLTRSRFVELLNTEMSIDRMIASNAVDTWISLLRCIVQALFICINDQIKSIVASLVGRGFCPYGGKQTRAVARESIPTLADIFYEYAYIRVCHMYNILQFSHYTTVTFNHQNYTYSGKI